MALCILTDIGNKMTRINITGMLLVSLMTLTAANTASAITAYSKIVGVATASVEPLDLPPGITPINEFTLLVAYETSDYTSLVLKQDIFPVQTTAWFAGIPSEYFTVDDDDGENLTSWGDGTASLDLIDPATGDQYRQWYTVTTTPYTLDLNGTAPIVQPVNVLGYTALAKPLVPKNSRVPIPRKSVLVARFKPVPKKK